MVINYSCINLQKNLGSNLSIFQRQRNFRTVFQGHMSLEVQLVDHSVGHRLLSNLLAVYLLFN